MLLLSLLVSGCITVSGPAGATPTPPSSLDPGSSPTPAPTPTPTPTPVPTPPPVDAEVVGFLPYWLVADAAETLDTDLLTIAALHGIEASAAGRLVSRKNPSGDVPPGWQAMESEAFGELKTRLQAAGVKVVPVIQRFGWTEGTARRTRELLTTRRARRSLATRIATFVDERGFDGVNLDVEPVPRELADEYVELVREVRRALDAVDPGLHLSVDVVASLNGYDLAALTADDAADLAVIMGYNYRTNDAAVAGSTAPLHDPDSGDLASTVEAALQQTAPESLVLALPWYGKAWSTEGSTPGSRTVSGRGIDGPAEPIYAQAIELSARSGREYEPDQASAWTAYPVQQCTTCPEVWRQVWYDDPDSFGAKIDHALGQGLAGVGVWALGQDGGRDELWWALRNRLRPRHDEAAPNGSASLDPETVKDDLDGRAVVEGVAALRLFAADEAGGSGLALARIGLAGDLDADGQLVLGRTYPAVDRIEFPLGDVTTGGAPEDGPRSIHVQWRDLAGNWSNPLAIEAWVFDPATSPPSS